MPSREFTRALRGRGLQSFLQRPVGARDHVLVSLRLSRLAAPVPNARSRRTACGCSRGGSAPTDRKSTRLNSSHTVISYAVFCLKKKKQTGKQQRHADANR